MRATTIMIGSMMALAGCATHPVPYAPAPLCSSAKECEVKWVAARRWVIEHCASMLKTYTSDYMETDQATEVARDLACRVSKERISKAEYRIVFEAECTANVRGCKPQDARNAFNSAVSAARLEQPTGAATAGSAP